MSTHPALAIGAVAGGPGSSREWTDAVMQLGRRVINLREGVVSPLAINVVYQMPGQFLAPEFEGVRTGRLSRKEAHLLVQVALPSESAINPSEVVLGFLREAVALAEDYARQEEMVEGELAGIRELVDRL